VTKINNELGSIELDHEEIVGVMPKMIMEFFVSDKSVLKPFAVGDTVEFTLRYRDGQETIIAIEKSE
jgi:Cu/Ag efflux protein CusF